MYPRCDHLFGCRFWFEREFFLNCTIALFAVNNFQYFEPAKKSLATVSKLVLISNTHHSIYAI